MFCALSGEVAEQPVVSKKTGHVFEKRLILKYIGDHGKCPITGDDLSADDLMDLQAGKVVRSRPPTATSIPSMIGLFQNEWDALMLETYSLREQLDQTRQELSRALYQNEAASRVVARLLKERDALKSQIAEMKVAPPAVSQAPSSHNGAASMEVDGPDSVTQEVIDAIVSHSTKLSKERKKRPAVEGLATPQQVAGFKEQSSNTALHATSPPGILSVDIHPSQSRIVTGGVDHHVVISDLESQAIVHTLKGHSKKVNKVAFHPSRDLVLSCSADKTSRIWTPSGDGYESKTVSCHRGEVAAMSLHPIGDYYVTASQDSTWAFVDLRTGKTLNQVSSDNTTKGYSAAAFHPDGLILGTGTNDSLIRIWDVKSNEVAATFEGHQNKITSLAFSENGYYLATSAEDQTVRVWDLRKLSNIKTFMFEQDALPVSTVRFDYSGNYLAMAADTLRIFATKNLGEVKQWDEVVKLGPYPAGISDVQFSRTASKVVAACMDRNLRVFG